MSKSATKKQNKASNPVSPGRQPRPKPTANATLPTTKNKVLAALPRLAPEEPCVVGVNSEELQSSKEELQSLNEELNTVNQQLQAKVGELEMSNSDLRNVLASSQVATLCLERNLLIKWFSPAARKVLGLIADDVGRPVSVFSTPLLGETLTVAVRTVLDRAAALEAEVQGEDDRWYLRRALPYRAENQDVERVIVTFTDITESKRNLEERTKQLRTFAFELTRAQESERQAIARDLHDDLGQLLSVVRLKLVKLQRGGEQADAPRILKEIDELVERAERSIRSLAVELSPPVLYELGLIPAVEWLAEEMKSNYGLSIEIVDDGAAKPLGQAARAILFRAIRELLINVAKHAGVGNARVIARRVGDGLVATVSDAGAGFDASEHPAKVQRGFGLTSVRERLAYIGGSLQIASRPGHGTEATMTVPLQSQEHLVRGSAG